MMPKSWKWKVILLSALTIYSCYLLVPTVFNFDAIKQKAYQKALTLNTDDTGAETIAVNENNINLPWYFNFFPDKGINLGLDLQGGIYMEFDVDTSRAIRNKVNSQITDIEYILKKKKITYTEITQSKTNYAILIKGIDNTKRSDILNTIQTESTQNFADNYHHKSKLEDDSTIIAFAPKKDFLSYLNQRIILTTLEKIRNRIDRYGVSEPSIQKLGNDRIAVELPGIDNPDRAINLIKEGGHLEFKLVSAELDRIKLAELISVARKEHTLPDNHSYETVAKLNEVLADKLPKNTEVAFHTQYDTVTKKQSSATPVLLNQHTAITGNNLVDAYVTTNQGRPAVGFRLDTKGTEAFGKTTKENVGKSLAIVLDGTVMSAPNINNAILNGEGIITFGSFANFSELQKEAEDLVLILKEGALPARLEEATKTVVGPSLGADSIQKGIYATLVGGILVFVFMIIYYRASGLIANIALAVNLLFILAALSLFQATLTLPGIAGIVLTLGIAVDANVLIFERIREELRKRKSAASAVKLGYHSAMRTIIDANITTLIAAIVLFQFGTGPIKGFAVTLMIGLAVSMYTACVCTRMVYDYFIIQKRITRISV